MIFQKTHHDIMVKIGWQINSKSLYFSSKNCFLFRAMLYLISIWFALISKSRTMRNILGFHCNCCRFDSKSGTIYIYFILNWGSSKSSVDLYVYYYKSSFHDNSVIWLTLLAILLKSVLSFRF